MGRSDVMAMVSDEGIFVPLSTGQDIPPEALNKVRAPSPREPLAHDNAAGLVIGAAVASVVWLRPS